jgi:ABC-2 type transport system ATP-binding protein
MSAISIQGVSKRFRINQDRQSSLKERAVHLGRAKRGYKDFWALRDINLEIAEGETVGLLGHNGSGKSTLLKCVGGILNPTEGEIRVRGRIASLLELGAGFHPDLTGRENVFLNASILGMSRRDIAARFDDIVAFAELEEFIDEQVKHYSSGMYVRLGFAVAINVEPDVLLVDEVLSVGDEAFQQKCLERVRGFQRDGRTIIFVSHASDLVRRICNRAMVLEHGQTVAIDDPASAILVFREKLLGEHLGLDRVLSHGHRITRTVRIEEVEIAWPGSDDRRSISPGEPVTVAVRYECDEPTPDVAFALAIRDTADITVYGCNSDVLGQPLGGIEGTGWVTFEIPAFTLVDGTYLIDVGVHTHDVVTEYDFVAEAGRITVVGGSGVVGIADLAAKVSPGRLAEPPH